MSDIDNPQNRALHSLAKRMNPGFNFKSQVHWIHESEPNEEGIADYKCLICNSLMFKRLRNGWYEPSPVEPVEDHSVKHLQEYNLTIFI